MSYRKRRGHDVNAQLAILGPAGASREDIEARIGEKLRGERMPKGWKVGFTDWRGNEEEPNDSTRQGELWNVFRNFSEQSEMDEPIEREADAEDLERWTSDDDSEE